MKNKGYVEVNYRTGCLKVQRKKKKVNSFYFCTTKSQQQSLRAALYCKIKTKTLQIKANN